MTIPHAGGLCPVCDGRPTVLVAIRHAAMSRLTRQLIDQDDCWRTVTLDGELLAAVLARVQPDLLVVDTADFPACCRLALAAFPADRVIVVGPEPGVGYETAALLAGAGAALARDDLATRLTGTMRRLLGCPHAEGTAASGASYTSTVLPM